MSQWSWNSRTSVDYCTTTSSTDPTKVYTMEKFTNNGAKYFKGTTKPNKIEAWTLNMLKTFRAMEIPESHWVSRASYMVEEEAAFWWEHHNDLTLLVVNWELENKFI